MNSHESGGGEEPTARACVLVVDDNEANRTLAKDTLEQDGHVVVCAGSGQSAIELFDSIRPDCALLDVRMPEVDGYAVCKHIRAAPLGGEIPVIFLTAFRDVDTFDRALRAGGDDFLTKPVRPTELLVRVRTALEVRRMKRSLREHFDVLKVQRDNLFRLQLQKERVTEFVIHDLKNPVNAIDLQAQLLLRDESLSPTTHETVRRIRESTKKLNRMILNLLDVARADEGLLEPKRSKIDAHQLIATVLDELRVASAGRGVGLRAEVDVDTLSADEDLVRRTMTNLIENALGYAPPGSTITAGGSRQNRDVMLFVMDRGPGIPPELREKIFDPFNQGRGSRSTSGQGLGLAFCRSVVDVHGGKIWVEDAAPGARFCLRLPQ